MSDAERMVFAHAYCYRMSRMHVERWDRELRAALAELWIPQTPSAMLFMASAALRQRMLTGSVNARLLAARYRAQTWAATR